MAGAIDEEAAAGSGTEMAVEVIGIDEAAAADVTPTLLPTRMNAAGGAAGAEATGTAVAVDSEAVAARSARMEVSAKADGVNKAAALETDGADAKLPTV